MHIQTKHFGEIDIDNEKVILFEGGLPGFLAYKKYILITDEEDPDSPFCWLQSIDNGDVAFALINPLAFYPHYAPKVSEDIIATLGEVDSKNLAVYSIVVVPEDITKMTANLKAPIIINIQTQKGMQVMVENEEYRFKHFIYEEAQEHVSEKAGV